MDRLDPVQRVEMRAIGLLMSGYGEAPTEEEKRPPAAPTVVSSTQHAERQAFDPRNAVHREAYLATVRAQAKKSGASDEQAEAAVRNVRAQLAQSR